MTSRSASSKAFRLALLGSLAVFQCAAAGMGGQARPQAERGQAQPAARRAALQVETVSAAGLPSGGTQGKVSFSNTDAKGECPAGSTKIERCSGVYANGTTWEIAPCCRTETN
ncbi:MAG: hypothetical protein ACOY82_20150 [Pseudomonadota bacterium]